MLSFENVLLVAKREYTERVRARSFLIMTILIPLLMGGIVGGGALFNRSLGASKHIAVVTDDAAFGPSLQQELAQGSDTKPQVDVYSPAVPGITDKLDAAMRQKNATLDGYLVVAPAADTASRPTYTWVPKAKADVVTRGRIADAVRAVLTRERLTRSGMGEAEINSLLAPVKLESNAGGGSSGAAFASAYGMFFLMYFVILFYGMNVARSIIEEKTSRVFEVLLATIKPTEMLAGKVIGVGSVGLTQVAIWVVAGVAFVKLQLLGAGSGLHILPSVSQTIFFAIYFLLGYLLYSSIAAALGAMTNSEQELQQLNIFLMLPLIFCSVVIMSVVTNPDSLLAKGLSFFPFCTPLIMYTRIIVGKPGIAAIAISLVEMVLTIAIVMSIAARIYRVGILMYGKKPNLPEILRWLRYT